VEEGMVAKAADKARGEEEDAEGVKRPLAVAPKVGTPRGQILHSKTRRVKLNRAGVVSSKLANRKKVVNHRRCNKNVGKTKRAMSASGTHGRDRKTQAISDHDGGRMS